MKIKVEPGRFKKMLEAGMIYKSKPLIAPLLVKFHKDGASIKDAYCDFLVVNIEMDKKFFLDYEAKEEEVVAIPSVVLDKLNWGFKDDEFEVYTEDNKFHLKGKTDSFNIELEESEPKPIPIKLKKTERGLIPEKIEPKSSFLLDSKELNLPQAEEYNFELKNKKLMVTIPGNGEFIRNLTGKVVGEEDIKVNLDGEFFNSITNNLDGEIFFVLTKDIVIFAEKKKHHMKTMFLGTRVAED